MTYPALSDCYCSDSHTMDEAESDYNSIERVRTMDKAVRGVRRALLPELGANVYIDAETGKLQPYTVSHLEGVASSALEDMERTGELSGYRVHIDPEQDVLRQGGVRIELRNVPVGVMRRIQVSIGYAKQV